MEDLVGRREAIEARYAFFQGRRVLVTGHTGFKGSWLCEWLLRLGADVHGIALPPEGERPLFDALRLEPRMSHTICDVRDAAALEREVARAAPEMVFHLAAQALVRRSYRNPLETWSTNVMGTANLLQAVRALGRPVGVVVVTTDKVYRNREWEFAYREEDELGGHDPYSASKAACELAVASWRAAFLEAEGIAVATARAGNVIGVGDNSEDRVVPDCFRAWRIGKAVEIRSPRATRPWQHVLEPHSGYLELMWHLCLDRDAARKSAFNFGPGATGVCSVAELVRLLAAEEPTRGYSVASGTTKLHEAGNLALSTDRAHRLLGWSPTLLLGESVAWTSRGYAVEGPELASLVAAQIDEFQRRRCA